MRLRGHLLGGVWGILTDGALELAWASGVIRRRVGERSWEDGVSCASGVAGGRVSLVR